MLSTIHTVDCIEVVTRLRKLGISSYDIGSVLATAIAQRLVRRICPNCARKREFTQQELDVFKVFGKRFDYEFALDGVSTFEPVGCEKCNNTGFYDRTAIYEIIDFSDIVRDMINSDTSIIEIRKQLLREGFEPIQVDAIKKILNGTTSFSEVTKKISFNNI